MIAVDNALARYFSEVSSAVATLASRPVEAFSPVASLPTLDARLEEYLSASNLTFSPLHLGWQEPAWLLNLMQNPGTNTTKTFASLLIVARAVAHVRATGERLTIVTPSSANKAIALRDAIDRAVRFGLVDTSDLNVVCLVPEASLLKLRATVSDSDDEFARLNPIMTYASRWPGDVKSLLASAVPLLQERPNHHYWYTLRLENYLAADVIRALAEAEFLPAVSSGRTHLHSVSSAYGLLGHAFGQREFLRSRPKSSYFLVQHLGVPDMVLGLYNNGRVSDQDRPKYSFDPSSGFWGQSVDPHFPRKTAHPTEMLDPTFYTRNPPTLPEMMQIIEEQGGGGIVVSRAECLELFDEAQNALVDSGVSLGDSPDGLREYSLLMAISGAILAGQRALLPRNEMVVHASGSYTTEDLGSRRPPVQSVSSAQDIAAILAAIR